MSTPLQRKLSEYLDCEVRLEKKWNPLRCPLHGDRSPSAAINWRKGIFVCKSGCGSMSLEKLHNLIFGENEMPTEIDELADALPDVGVTVKRGKKSNPEEEKGEPPSMFHENVMAFAAAFIEERGVSQQTYVDLDITPILDPLSPNFGYIEIPHVEGRFIRRKFIDGMKGPRYQNADGEGQPFYGLDRLADDTKDVILVEGIYDYMALYEMGYRNIVAALMSDITEKNAYSLKGKTVFLLLDCDYAGYKGGKKALTHFREMGANPIILDLPKGFGKDPHLAWRYARQSFSPWLAEELSKYDSVDAKYIRDSFLTNKRPLAMYPTGVFAFDTILGGGLKAGVHIVGGKPGSGKSMLANAIATKIAIAGGRVLNCTYELPKEQVWARTASQFDEHTWAEIEVNPLIVNPNTRQILEKLGENIRVVAGWNANEIERAVSHFDVVIVDYIQRMPSSKPEVKQGVSDNIQRLSNLARDQNKIIIVISSLPRSGYAAEGEMGVFKESGDIEYVCQSATIIKKPTGGDYLACSVLKNTRGPVGNFALEGNMAHCQFTEVQFMTEVPTAQ